MTVVALKPSHLEEIRPQKMQPDPLEPQEMLSSKYAVAHVVDGKVVAISGIALTSDGVGLFWSVLAEGSQRHMIRFYRHGRRICNAWRGGLCAFASFPQAERFLRMLGFQFVQPTPVGNLYTRGM